MHELPVTESILEIAQRHAQEAGAKRITDLYLVIGQLSSMMDDSIQFYWDILSEGTVAAGATLHFERIAAELLCLDCSQRYELDGEDLACPHCGGAKVKVVDGEQFQLQAIDVEMKSADEESVEGALV
ncbi:MAG: hydrogenase maturation nickel metallochaperone HypA [Anaerolineales bacterium]